MQDQSQKLKIDEVFRRQSTGIRTAIGNYERRSNEKHSHWTEVSRAWRRTCLCPHLCSVLGGNCFCPQRLAGIENRILFSFVKPPWKVQKNQGVAGPASAKPNSLSSHKTRVGRKSQPSTNDPTAESGSPESADN